MDAANCTHSLVNNLEVDTSKAKELSLTIYPFDNYGNAVATETSFNVNATLNGVAFWNKTVASGSKESIPVQESSTGVISINMTLNGVHIKGSPHKVEAFVPDVNKGLSTEMIMGIVGGFMFVLLLVAVIFWQQKKKAAARIAEEKQRAEELKVKQQAEEKMKAAWNKLVDCHSNKGWCVCNQKCIQAYFSSLSPEDQKAIKTAQNGGISMEKWIERADAFNKKHKNGEAERRARDHREAAKKRKKT